VKYWFSLSLIVLIFSATIDTSFASVQPSKVDCCCSLDKTQCVCYEELSDKDALNNFMLKAARCGEVDSKVASVYHSKQFQVFRQEFIDFHFHYQEEVFLNQHLDLIHSTSVLDQPPQMVMFAR